MAIRKDGVNQNLDERNKDLSSSEFNRVNDEENTGTRTISNDAEEGDDDVDGAELEDDDELTEEDFDVDGDDEEEDEVD